MYGVELVMKLDFKCSVTQYEQSNCQIPYKIKNFLMMLLMSPEGGL